LHDNLLTRSAFERMATLLALMATDHNLVTRKTANWNRIQTRLSVIRSQNHCVHSSTATFAHLFRSIWAFSARSRVTNGLAFMVSTVQGLSTDLLAAKVLISAFSDIGLFAAITSNFFDYFTARTRARMANFFTVVFTTVFSLVTNLIARKSSIFIATSCSHLLASTITNLFLSDCSTRRAGTRMAC